MARALTDIAIRNLRAEPKRREIPDPGARGLYVVIQPSGVRSFAVRYCYAGKSRKLTLGGGELALAAARTAASHAKEQIEAGHDPAAEKHSARKPAAGGAAIDHWVAEFIARHVRINA